MPAERYYALILMDGDRLGSWLSGENALGFGDAFHTKVRAGLARYRDERLAKYLGCKRPTSPARHMAISSALNGFALDLVRHVVEDLCLGKLLYAGGDDVMAMVCVRDLLKMLWLLREVYSGGTTGGYAANLFEHDFDLRRGFVQWRNRLYQVMGQRATASAGAVIAHHQAPLGAVLRELRAAESRAKTEGGRDAFSLTVVKRSGGALTLTDKWGEPVALLADLRAFLAERGVSRRAVYHTLEWLNEKDLPEPEGDGDMLQSLLAYQFDRQTDKTAKEAKAMVPSLAERLTAQALAKPRERVRWLRNVLSVAEFLARETRTGESA